jgi:diadenosine tetraphosphate (Ap4A) HIT family hydrolase
MNQFNAQTRLFQKDCIFCQQKFTKILFSTPEFVISLDDFPLSEGHLLLFSKDHHGCGGELPKQPLSELVTLKNKAASILRQQYGTVIFYEHGRAGHCVSFGPDQHLCHHFHLHALPIHHDISDKLAEQFQRVNMASYADIDNYFNKFGEYLFFENNAQEAFFYPVVNAIQPHLLRTLIAHALAAPERADWEHFHDTQFIDTALEKAAAYISFI